MGLVCVGPLSLSVVSNSMSDEAWQSMLDWSAQNLAGVSVNLGYQVAGSVTSKQRQMASAGSNALKRIALLTDSVVIRGTLTAYGWLTRGQSQYQAYAPQDLEAGLAWLAEVATFDDAAAAAAITELCQRMSVKVPWGSRGAASAASR